MHTCPLGAGILMGEVDSKVRSTSIKDTVGLVCSKDTEEGEGTESYRWDLPSSEGEKGGKEVREALRVTEGK